MRRLLQLVIFFVISALLGGCGERGPQESYVQGTALIGVSDAVYDVAASTAQQYQKLHNTAFVSVYRHNTQALLDSLINRSADEIFIDRAPTAAETTVFAQREVKLLQYPVCYYPLFMLVDSSLGVTSIDSAKLRGILTGEITSWDKLGGPKVTVRPYLPLPGTGAWTSVMEYYGELDSVAAVICSTDTKMLELAAGDPGALLFYSHPLEDLSRYLDLRWARNELRIPANVKTILEHPRYPFKMKFTYLTTRNKVDVAAGYLTFMVENNGQKFVMQQGYRPASVPVRVIHMKE